MLDNSIQKKLSFQKFLPILNTSNLKKDITRLEKLISKHENVECVEITLRNEDSFDIAVEIKKQFPNLLFGLGTVLDKKNYIRGSNEGFSFFVSPCIIKELLDLNPKNYIPAGETISDFIYLKKKNYEIVKFFPASLMGGDKKLISIQNIIKELKFIPTGGIDNNNISSYLNLENVLCVGMSKFD